MLIRRGHGRSAEAAGREDGLVSNRELEQWIAPLDALAWVYVNALDDPLLPGAQLVVHLHRFEDQQNCSALDELTCCRRYLSDDSGHGGRFGFKQKPAVLTGFCVPFGARDRARPITLKHMA